MRTNIEEVQIRLSHVRRVTRIGGFRTVGNKVTGAQLEFFQVERVRNKVVLGRLTGALEELHTLFLASVDGEEKLDHADTEIVRCLDFRKHLFEVQGAIVAARLDEADDGLLVVGGFHAEFFDAVRGFAIRVGEIDLERGRAIDGDFGRNLLVAGRRHRDLLTVGEDELAAGKRLIGCDVDLNDCPLERHHVEGVLLLPVRHAGIGGVIVGVVHLFDPRQIGNLDREFVGFLAKRLDVVGHRFLKVEQAVFICRLAFGQRVHADGVKLLGVLIPEEDPRALDVVTREDGFDSHIRAFGNSCGTRRNSQRDLIDRWRREGLAHQHSNGIRKEHRRQIETDNERDDKGAVQRGEHVVLSLVDLFPELHVLCAVEGILDEQEAEQAMLRPRLFDGFHGAHKAVFKAGILLLHELGELRVVRQPAQGQD